MFYGAVKSCRVKVIAKGRQFLPALDLCPRTDAG